LSGSLRLISLSPGCRSEPVWILFINFMDILI
jgi:hypothetical protein